VGVEWESRRDGQRADRGEKRRDPEKGWVRPGANKTFRFFAGFRHYFPSIHC
jgi:hypothetical protein